MLSTNRCIRQISMIQKNLDEITKCVVQYSQRCNYDDCGCLIPEPKCKKRPEVVKEVNCDKCRFECWQYKPRPRFTASKTKDSKKASRLCTAGMIDTSIKKPKVEKCENRADAPIGACQKPFTGNVRKSRQENPYKFENERIPLPDWDFNKRPLC